MATTSACHTPASVEEARGRPLADVVLETIWHHRRISRADLARTLGISRSRVSDIVGDLLETGLVEEGGAGPSRGGRRAILLAFRDDAHVILGVDMGATHVAVGLTDLRGRILVWHDRDHPVREDPAGTRALITELCDRSLKDWGGPRDRLIGIGIAVPSPVDPRFPDRLSSVVLPAWEGESGFGPLRERYGVPIFVDNDANLGAVAERWWGAGRGVEHFTYIKLATGIGAGLMIGGDVYRGATQVAGEIGHVSIDPHGEPCVCGNRGCLVTFVGGEALVARTRALLEKHPESRLAAEEGLTLGAIERAAQAGDPLAVQVVGWAAQHLGVALAGLLNLMNPGAVILGGGLTRAGDHLLVPLREAVLRRTLVNSVAALEIRMSELGPRSTGLGAATLVLASALADPRLFTASGA
ncbi:MAG: ROK family transcriptional regulator [Longimicrobiales bacterium]|nr:ROK family transcriptional regulator [Longimicrobiales bacterium]